MVTLPFLFNFGLSTKVSMNFTIFGWLYFFKIVISRIADNGKPSLFLILILNRGRGNSFECDVEFPHQLDISRYAKDPSSPKIYELIGVISHLGESSMEGHFIAFCKHFDFNWYFFNDGIVSQVSPNDIYKGTPYILFYQNINFN